MHSDGTFVGRSAPEIDMFEAQVKGTPLVGAVSQSAQWAVGFFISFSMILVLTGEYASHLMQVSCGRIPLITRLSTTLQSLHKICLSAMFCSRRLPALLPRTKIVMAEMPVVFRFMDLKSVFLLTWFYN